MKYRVFYLSFSLNHCPGYRWFISVRSGNAEEHFGFPCKPTKKQIRMAKRELRQLFPL